MTLGATSLEVVYISNNNSSCWLGKVIQPAWLGRLSGKNTSHVGRKMRSRIEPGSASQKRDIHSLDYVFHGPGRGGGRFAHILFTSSGGGGGGGGGDDPSYEIRAYL